MGDKVFINGEAAVHSGSAGKVMFFPNVCLSPPGPPGGPVPVPYLLPPRLVRFGFEGCRDCRRLDAHSRVYLLRCRVGMENKQDAFM